LSEGGLILSKKIKYKKDPNHFMRPSIIRKINPQKPEPEIIAEAAAVIRQGGVLAFPTRCLYGLGADAFNPEAVERVVKIKQRSQQNPILVLVDSRKQLKSLVTHIPPAADAIMDAFWPGRLTLVFEARNSLPDQAQTGKIGIRLPGHPVAAAIARQVKGPVTGTSANISGQPGCCRAQDLDPAIAGQLGLILDAGTLIGGQDLDPAIAGQLGLILDAGTLIGGIGSTVVDVTSTPPQILREGAVTAKEVLSC
jgi:L-threonylcarbamoyladenylate synthase